MCQKLRIALSFILFLPFLLSSCFSIHVDMTMRRSGRIDLELEYIIDESTAQYGRGFGADEPWLLPLTEKDFRLQAMRSNGMEIKKYKHRQLPDGRDQIRVNLRADSMDAIAEYFNWDIRQEKTGREETLILILPALKANQLKESTGKILKNLLSDGKFVLRIKPPGKPNNVSGGEIDGTYALYSIMLEQIAWTEKPIIWSLSW